MESLLGLMVPGGQYASMFYSNSLSGKEVIYKPESEQTKQEK